MVAFEKLEKRFHQTKFQAQSFRQVTAQHVAAGVQQLQDQLLYDRTGQSRVLQGFRQRGREVLVLGLNRKVKE